MNDQPEPPESLKLAERVAELERQVARLRERLGENEPVKGVDPPPLRRTETTTPRPMPPRGGKPAASRPSVATASTPGASPPPEPIERATRSADSPSRPRRDFRSFLRRWHLWPPEGNGNFEEQVGAWWATRIGALLAVIGVVFFGLYVAHGTPPWVRWIQLAAVAFGVTGAGHWLERKEARFGAVVFGSGLALVFFAGFAAYAVPAVKIVAQPLLGTALQGVVVGGITVASLWKNRSHLATMAILFGFVTCLFSFLAQLQDISLIAAFLLAAAGGGLWLAKGWLAPFACSVPSAYLIYGVLVIFGWGHAPPSSFSLAIAFPVAAFLLFAVTDFAGLQRQSQLRTAYRRLLQGGSATGAAGLGFLVTNLYFGDLVAHFYFLFASLILIGSLLYYLRDQEDEQGHLWFAAGMGFLALGLVEILDARTRWLALAIQSGVVLFAARRTRLWTAEAVMGAVWLASAGLFLADTAGAGYFRETGNVLSLWGAAAGAYLLISGLLLSLQGRWFAGRPSGFVDTGDAESVARMENGRFQLNVLYGILLGAVGCAAAVAGFSATYLPTGAIAVGLLLVLCGAVARCWVGFLAAGFLFVLGQWSFWWFAESEHPDLAVWLNGAVAIISAVVAAVVAHWALRRDRLEGELTKILPGLTHLFWLISVQMLLFKAATLETNLLVAAFIGLLLVGLAGWRKVEYLADLVPASAVLAWVMVVVARLEGRDNLVAGGDSMVLWIATAGIFAAVCVRDCWGRLDGLAGLFPSGRIGRLAGAVAATIGGLYLIGREFEYPVLIGVMGLGSLLVLALGRWPGWATAAASAAVFVLAGHAALWGSLGLARGDELFWALLLAGTTLGFAVLARDRRLVRGGAVTFIQWMMAVLATSSLFLLFLTRSGLLEPYTTALWGMSATVVFAAGLIWRVKPLRVVGLIGLGICLPRIFLVDIHSTFYRIAAFVVVGVVLLLVGFLYHRFRSHINEAAVVATDPEN